MSDLATVEARMREKARKRAERAEREGVNCNCCCSSINPDGTETPGCLEDSCKVIAGNLCPRCGKKVAPEGAPTEHEMTRGGKKTRKKRRRKRRKTHKKRRKTKRKKRRRKKKKSRRRRK